MIQKLNFLSTMKTSLIIKLVFIFFILLILVAYNYFIPTKFENKCKDKNIFKYKFGIYKAETLASNIVEYKKIGGFLAFLNSKDAKCLEEIETEHYLNIKNNRERITTSLQWKKLRCGLYINKNGVLGFKDYRVIGSERLVTEEYYITKLGFDEGKPLQAIIDTATFYELGNTYYKDKDHIYHFYGMAGGGSFYIFDEADYTTFEILGDCYARDKNSIYEMRSGKLDSVDYHTFKSILGQGCYAKDKNGYYSWGTKIEERFLNDSEVKEVIKKLNQ